MGLVQQISNGLGLPISYIRKLERSASYRYKRYEISRHGGKPRTIYHPAKPLKVVQRWLARNIVEKWPVHDCVNGYRKSVTTADNAKKHVSSQFLLRLDLKGFFESIKSSDVLAYLSNVETAWDTADKVAFASLVCRNRQLTIGAPSSPSLSNAICYDLDMRLYQLAETRGATYTRYSDDLFFSLNQPDILSSFPGEVEKILSALTVPANLVLNKAKTRHSSRKGRRIVTGIVLGSDGQIYVGRRVKRKIRALIHQYSKLDTDQRKSLAGLISYVQGIDPEFVNSLIKKYGFEVVRVARTHLE